MLYQEQIQRRRSKRSDEQPVDTFPEAGRTFQGGSGGPDDTDEILARIERDLKESTILALSEAAGIKAE